MAEGVQYVAQNGGGEYVRDPAATEYQDRWTNALGEAHKWSVAQQAADAFPQCAIRRAKQNEDGSWSHVRPLYGPR